MCALRRHVCHSPDPVYAGPFVAMGGKHYSFLLLTKIDNILFLARNVCFRAQPGGGCDVGGGGMSSILGSARSLLQEYAVKGALLCTAGTTFLFHKYRSCPTVLLLTAQVEVNDNLTWRPFPDCFPF